VKSLMKLWQLTADDLAVRCRTSTIRDNKTVAERVENEGISFFTITLPAFCSDFERSLAEGRVDHDAFCGFRRTQGLPRFLGGFLDLIFDRCTGLLVQEPCIEAIFAVRQLTKMYNKVLLECSSERTEAALYKYLDCEQEIRSADEIWANGNTQSRYGYFYSQPNIATKLDSKSFDELARIAQIVMGRALSQTNTMVYYGDVYPKHGRGATADYIRGNAKYVVNKWYSRLEEVFPMREFIIPNQEHFSSELEFVALLEPEAEIPVKVTTVPKTLKTPRIIAEEPTHMMYMQQAIWLCLSKNLVEDRLSSKFISFKKQELNQQMCLKGSLTGELATLDLSEASDRVSNELVKRVFAKWPALLQGLQATRSTQALVPLRNGHKIISLAKYASMGSALTFPIEMVVFLAIIFLGIEDGLKRPITKKDVKSFKGKVRVYGDDLIIPVEYVPFVISRLEAFGFKVNASKSFWTGSFRESCGKEYYAGTDVSIVRVRTLLPTSRHDVDEIISTVSLRNQLYMAGLWGPVRWLDELLGRLIPFPIVDVKSSVLGRHSVIHEYQVDAYCPEQHHPLVKGAVVRSVIPKSPLDGYAALLKCFLKARQDCSSYDEDFDRDNAREVSQINLGDSKCIFGHMPMLDKEHLGRQGRPLHVGINVGWVKPF